ncbi:MAG: 3-isopropylmalate dehydratase small subunit, partial [Actinomycetota bacterium]
IPEETVKAITDLVEKDPSTEITIDVDTRTVSVASAGIATAFPLDDFARYRLMNGLDDIGLTMQRQEAIGGYEATRPAWSPAINDR